MMHIVKDGIAAWDQKEGDAGGEQNPESETDRHGDQELGLYALFQDHGCQTRKGGQRRV